MVQVATFGIGVNEVMKIATACTLILALLLPMGEMQTDGTPRYSLEKLPWAFIESFNRLWFDNWSFFKSTNEGCIGNIQNIGKTNELGYIVPANSTVNVTQANNTSSFQQLDFVNQVIFGAWYLIPGTIPKNIGETEKTALQTDNPVSAFVGGVVTMLQLVFGSIYYCGVGSFRLVIGLSIAFYWFLKTIPLWQLLFNMFMALIG